MVARKSPLRLSNWRFLMPKLPSCELRSVSALSCWIWLRIDVVRSCVAATWSSSCCRAALSLLVRVCWWSVAMFWMAVVRPWMSARMDDTRCRKAVCERMLPPCCCGAGDPYCSCCGDPYCCCSSA